MTAPERFADSQIPLAPRAPSIHDPEPTQGGLKSRSAAVYRRTELCYPFRRPASGADSAHRIEGMA